ncbi:Blue-light-activated protein [Luteitalea pratensis]|uniref:histidine kinase n=1 Tax=Luteitalea pratensis TaxID=1855912 RepID=A0A143PP19_LUTPR|nr:Blue-light-activated protein [Luteitalea pratensis]
MHSPRDGGRTTGEQESIGRVIGQRDLAGLVDGPGPWRARLLVLILRVTLIAGVLVYLPSAYVALAKGLPSIALAATLALVVVLTLVLSPGVAFRWSATFYCLNFYVLGVALIVWFRPMSQIFLFAVTTFTTILLGLRVGFVSSILCTLTLLAMGLIGWAAPGVLWPGRSVDLTSWGVITLSFALVNMVVTLAIGVVLAMLDDALEREIGARVSLDRERTVLRTLIDTLPDIIFTKDRQGRYVIVNAATLAQADVAREADLIGKLDSDVFPPERAHDYLEGDRRVFGGEELRNVEVRTVRADGRTTWHLTTKVPLLDASGAPTGLIGIGRDITDRKRAEAERSHLLSRLQVQIERMPLAYLTTDADFRFTRWNPAAERLFGYSEAEVLGRHPFDVIVTEQSRADMTRIFAEVVAGNMDAHVEAENRTRDGRTITCEWHNTPIIEADGTFAGLLSLAQDVTERHNLEHQLRQAQKMEAVGQLAGGVAHDFNNLLTLINGYSELLLADQQLGAVARASAQAIREAGERATTLTRQLLGFSRKSLLQPRVLDLNTVVADTSAMLRRLIGENIILSTVLAPRLHHVKIDPSQLNQVLMNLVVNARDAMPSGGRLTLETGNVMRGAENEEGAAETPSFAHAMLSITDTGGGMTPDVMARIFEPFYTTKPVGVGTGLGLAMVFGVVRQSGGSIDVQSAPGSGSRFTLYFPAVADPIPAEVVATEAVPDVSGHETILIVEDEENVRELLLRSLARHGYTLLTANDGHDALRVATRHKGGIDLVLTDVVMPHMGGPELVTSLRTRLPAVKALFMSGYTDDAMVRHGLLMADVSFIQKPYTPLALARKIRDVLDDVPEAGAIRAH